MINSDTDHQAAKETPPPPYTRLSKYRKNALLLLLRRLWTEIPHNFRQ